MAAKEEGAEALIVPTQLVAIGKLKPAKYNPRKDLKPDDPEYQKLETSITKFGLVENLVWNKRTGNLVGGHQRLKILKAKGVKKVEVAVVDLDDHDEAALNIALNKIEGQWDYAKLGEVLSALDAEGYDATLTGFDPEELEAFLTGWEPMKDPNAEADDYDPEAETFLVKIEGVLSAHKTLVVEAVEAALVELGLEYEVKAF